MDGAIGPHDAAEGVDAGSDANSSCKLFSTNTHRRLPKCGSGAWRLNMRSCGRDVRLMERDDFRRTQLCKEALAAHELADKWRGALIDVGWMPS